MKWDENDISVCLSIMLTSYLQLLIELFEGSFFRAAIPKDVTAGSPKPSQWGPPSAMLKNTGCDITKYFMKHTIVFGKYWHNYGALRGRLINNWPRYYTLRCVFRFMISALVLTYIKQVTGLEHLTAHLDAQELAKTDSWSQVTSTYVIPKL